MSSNTNVLETVSKIDLYSSDKLKQLNGMQTVAVTPALASKWLAFNLSNRNVNDSHVSRLAKTMQKGDWMLNGQAIVFSTNGNLLDGQHRLHAIMEAKKTIKMDVRFGVEENAMMTIDEGKKRTSGDVLQINGFINSKHLASAARKIMRYDEGQKDLDSGFRILNPTNHEVYEWVIQNPSLQEVVSLAMRNTSMAADSPVPASLLATFMFICNRFDRELSKDFYYRLSTGVGLEIDSIVFKLRNRLNQGKNNPAIKFSQNYVIGLVVTAWNHERDGSEVVSLRYTPRKGVTPQFK